MRTLMFLPLLGMLFGFVAQAQYGNPYQPRPSVLDGMQGSQYGNSFGNNFNCQIVPVYDDYGRIIGYKKVCG